MPRTISLAVPCESTDDLIAALDDLDILGLRLHRNASLRPAGDVVELEVANEVLGDVMQVADDYGLGKAGGVSMATAEPLSVISGSRAQMREAGTTTWEELQLSMGADSTMTTEKILIMLMAGFIAGIGIIADTIHIVVGAMVIAPGFQPFARFVLGLVVRHPRAWKGGLVDIGRAYAALMVGAAVAGVFGRWLGASAFDAGLESYVDPGGLVAYWTTLSWTGVAVGAVAAICGGLLTAINRTVLTAGVMVALALVPTAAMITISLVGGDLATSAAAFVRFVVEVGLVLAGSLLVFGVKSRRDGRRVAD